MYERFTDRARKVMQLANTEAQKFNHEYIGTEHILLGLIKEASGVAANVLKNLDVDLRKVRLEVEKIVQAGPGGDQVELSRLPHTPRAKQVIEFSVDEARRLNHQYIGTEHLLLGLLREQEGVAAQVLMNLGLRLDEVRDEVLNLLGHIPHGDSEPGDDLARWRARLARSRSSTLDSLGRDLGELAREGKLPPLIGRHTELAVLCEILLCRSRNAAVVLGETGVGKTTLVAGLCRMVIDGRVPDGLRNRYVLALPLSRLWADARDWSHLLNRTRALFDALRRDRKTVLYLPDAILSMAHSAGNTAAQRVHAELLLALQDGQIPVVLAGTPGDYRLCLGPYPSLEGLVQPVVLGPATVEETVAVLRGVRDRYEKHHSVGITDEALTAAAEWADRQLPGVLPGKAVRLLDRAAARGRVRAGTGSPDLIARLRDLDARIDRLNREKEDFVASHDFQRAAEKRNEADVLKKEREQLLAEQQTQTAVAAMVDPALIAEVARDLAAESATAGPAMG